MKVRKQTRLRFRGFHLENASPTNNAAGHTLGCDYVWEETPKRCGEAEESRAFVASFKVSRPRRG